MLTKLCIKKVLNPTDTTSPNENCLVDFSDNLADQKEIIPHSGQADAIKDELQRSPKAAYSCILCNTNHRSKKNFNRHVKSKHARANQDALLSLVDENESNKSDKLVSSLRKAQEPVDHHDEIPQGFIAILMMMKRNDD